MKQMLNSKTKPIRPMIAMKLKRERGEGGTKRKQEIAGGNILGKNTVGA